MPTRRNFLTTSAQTLAGSVALTLPDIAYARMPKTVAPSDRLRIGAIGINGRGWSDVQTHLKVPGVDVVARCDVDQARLRTIHRLTPC